MNRNRLGVNHSMSGFILPQVMIFILFLMTMVSMWMFISQNESKSLEGSSQSYKAKYLAQMGMERAQRILLDDRDWSDFDDTLFDTDYLGGHYKTDLNPIDKHTVDITSVGKYEGKKYTFTKRYQRPTDIAWEMFVNRTPGIQTINTNAGSTTIKLVQLSMVNVTENRTVQQMRVAWSPQYPGEKLDTLRIKVNVFKPSDQDIHDITHQHHHNTHDSGNHFHHDTLSFDHHHFHDIGNDPEHDNHASNPSHHHHDPVVVEDHYHENDKRLPGYGALLDVKDFTFTKPVITSHSHDGGPADHDHIELKENQLSIGFPQVMIGRTYTLYFYFTDGSVYSVDVGPDFLEE